MVFAVNEFPNFINSKIPLNGDILVLIKDFKANNLWYIKKVLIIEHYIEIILVLLQLFCSDFLSFDV